MNNHSHRIAIIGLSLRFPGANSYKEFWNNLISEKDSGEILSPESLTMHGREKKQLNHPDYVFRSYEIDNMDQFDASFFGLSPREARLADPQLRLLLESSYECIEDSGYNLTGENVGVYVGAADHKYWLYHHLFQSPLEDDQEIAKRIYVAKDYFATQISHKLDLRGPSISLSSACSSSLLAVHEACNHLLMFDCDYALVGGSELVTGAGYKYEEGGLMSRDGFVRAFDQNASGTVFGSGVGMVLLRRFEDAIEMGDHIYAVINSTAVNNDGSQKVGYVAPSIHGQMGVIQEAIIRSGADARNIGYVEAHGTGTPVGDPIEVEALSRVYRRYTDENQFCAIGSVKTNVGHLSFAAGIAGLIKVALMLHHKKIPASLHYSNPNPEIRFEDSPFFVNCELKDWESSKGTRIAGLSAFGVGGTNVHAIIEQAEIEKFTDTGSSSAQLILLSAKSKDALDEQKKKLGVYLREHPDIQMSALSYTLSAGRIPYDYRFHLVTSDRVNASLELLAHDSHDEMKSSIINNPSVVFMFPGQGAQYVDMAKGLYENEPEFRKHFDSCANILQSDLSFDIFALLFPSLEEKEKAAKILDRTENTQLCLFVVSYSLAKFWIYCGVSPKAMIGHSLGEYVAACLSGVFSLEDVLMLISARGRLMQKMEVGKMLSVPLPLAEITPLLNKALSIAAVNSPASTVVSGPIAAIEELNNRLSKEGVRSQLLHSSRAFHSAMMEPMLNEFEQAFLDINLAKPSIPFVSNLTGKVILESEATSPLYWCNHLLNTVLFSSGIELLSQNKNALFLEVGPGAALSSLVAQHELDERSVAIPSMHRKISKGVENYESFLSALGQIWCKGVAINWDKYYAKKVKQRVSLPTYPFQRKSFWLDPQQLEEKKDAVIKSKCLEHPLLGMRIVSSSRMVVYENYINHRTTEYLIDHKLNETVIFPGAGFTQMAMDIGKLFIKNRKIQLDEIAFVKALMLTDGANRVVQTIATAEGSSACYFEILSCKHEKSGAEPDRNWILHARGRVSAHALTPPKIEISDFRDSNECEITPIDSYYKSLKFVNYGPSFRSIKRLWLSEGKSLGWVELPENLKSGLSDYSFHPVLMDACFQVISSLSECNTLPIGVKNLVLYSEIPPQFFVAARLENSEEADSIGSMSILSSSGKVIAQFCHYLQKRIVDDSDIGDQIQEIIYEMNWKPLNLSNTQIQSEENEIFAIVGDNSKYTEQLEGSLSSVGYKTRLIDAEITSANKPIFLKNTMSEHTSAHSKLLTTLSDSNLSSIVFMSALNQNCNSENICIELLGLIKCLTSIEVQKHPKLYVVTKGSQFTGYEGTDSEFDECGLEQAALWGMGNSVVVEHPELNCTRIDLDPHMECLDNTKFLMESIMTQCKENQLVCRNGNCYVPRLERRVDKLMKGRIRIPSNTYQIRLSEFGTFDNFIAKEIFADSLAPDEVQVELRATSLNFKETLYILGLLSSYNGRASDLEFGLEGAGVVTRVGSNVSDLMVGDSVIVWHSGCLSSVIVVRADCVIAMPKDLTYVQAATIPTVYMTAYHALHSLAKISAGDRVLIHASAGGVGQVALQIAKSTGAEVFATASKGKWDHLRSQGVHHLYDSRTLEFCEKILESTEGRGVDIVLNSFAGEFIKKSFDVLAKGGRFVEIGKTDIWSIEQAQAHRPDVKYFPFELGEGMVNGEIGKEGVIHTLMRNILSDFQSGKISTLPIKEYFPQDVAAAYRYLSAGKNIGKVVVNLQAQNEESKHFDLIRNNRTYIITGGLGALGLLCTEWLVSHGATSIVLMGRSEVTESVKEELKKYDGLDIFVYQGDVASANDVENMIAQIDNSSAPLAGVLHCAGVLDDATLQNQDIDKFQKCFSPKVVGSKLLHELTKKKQLDFFVCFSSVSALFDGGGQANYAAANSYMDHLMNYRRRIGLPGLTVNWGGWAEVGMAARLDSLKANDRSIYITKKEAFSALEKLMCEGLVQAVVCKIGVRLSGKNVPILFSELVTDGKSPAQADTELENILIDNPNNSLRENLKTFVSNQVVKILGLDPGDEIASEEDFTDLGIDSLSSTELKNSIQSGLSQTIPMAVLFSHASIDRLTDYLVAEIDSSQNTLTEFSKENIKKESTVEIINISEHSHLPRVFCIPSVLGSAFEFDEFSKNNRDKYNISIAQFSEENIETDLSKIAQATLTLLKRGQPAGPYALIGYSYGGVVALEIANELVKQGDEVSFVFMLDTYPHFIYHENERFGKWMSAILADGMLRPLSLDNQSYKRKVIELISGAARISEKVNSGSDIESPETQKRNLDQFEKLRLLTSKRTETPYQVPADLCHFPVHLVRANKHPEAIKYAELSDFLDSDVMKNASYGWEQILGREVDIVRVNGQHNTILKGQSLSEIISVLDALFSDRS